MNIFLDTNVFYNDPFLQKGKNPILLRLARHEDVKLFINETVYSEILRQHKAFLDQKINSANDALAKIMPFLNVRRDQFDLKVKLSDLLSDFSGQFEEFKEEERLHIIPYDADVLKHIVDNDMFDKPPFVKIKQLTNKDDKKITYKKKEVRDSIIWHSYQVYIEKMCIEDCFFISNNTKEFGVDGSSKGPKEQPYPLHPELSKNDKITAFRTVHDFLAYNNDKIKDLFQDTELHTQILSQELYDQVYDELEDGLAEELIKKHFKDQIFYETFSYLSEKQTDDIHEDYFMGGYISPSTDGEITNFSLEEVDIYGEDIVVAVYADVEVDVDIYLYNPVHDGRHDKFEYHSTDTVKVTEGLVFLLPIDTSKVEELTNETFSLRKYIEGIEPTNLDIDVNHYQNIYHQDMFPEPEPEYVEYE
ncbi:PIN domain-containing protein [Priestia megaterium]|uniref:PIN domain-containing protein n=1 Tax=Priestia megaterium TaxID=1404 RepID=UPI00398FF4E3